LNLLKELGIGPAGMHIAEKLDNAVVHRRHDGNVEIEVKLAHQTFADAATHRQEISCTLLMLSL
jgi:hypothetical protein